MPDTGGAIKVLGHLSSPSQGPTGSVAVSNGFVYDSTFGANNPGSVFEVPIGGGTVTTGPIFSAHAAEYGLIADGGAVIGLTAEGGSSGVGTVYAVDPNTLAATDIADFNNGSTGGGPSGLSLDGHGNLYGSSFGTQNSSPVTIFWKLSLDGGTSPSPSPTSPSPSPSPSPTPSPSPSPTPTPAPLPTTAAVIGEQPIFAHKSNRKGKSSGKQALSGLSLNFGIPLDPGAAANAGNYQIGSFMIKKGKKKTQMILQPIEGFEVSYLPTSEIVQITFGTNQTFANGGQITILGGLTTASGGGLTGIAKFTISKGGRSVTPS